MTVEIALATEDAIAKERAQEFMDGHAFVEIIGMFDQNAMNMLRFIEQDGRERPKMHAADVALACYTLKEAQAVFSVVGHVSDKWVPTDVVKCF